NMNGKDDEVVGPEVPEPILPQDKGPALPKGRQQFPDMNRMMPPPGLGNMGNNGNGVTRRKGNHDPNIERTPPADRGNKNNGNGTGKIPPRDPREPMGTPGGNNYRPSEEEIMRMEM